MTIAFWRDEYKCGNVEIDKQHQNLFNIINKLHNSMMEGEGQYIIEKTLRELIVYTIEHFECEEQLMLTYHYPGLTEHKAKHDDLREKVKLLEQKLKNRETSVNREMLHFLHEWILHHIKGEDRKLVKFLQEKNSLVLA